MSFRNTRNEQRTKLSAFLIRKAKKGIILCYNARKRTVNSAKVKI